jgi:hypothetical protein
VSETTPQNLDLRLGEPRPLGGAPGARARQDTSMNTADLDKAIQQAKTDLAFALAQGDGYAEDEAAERLAKAERDRDAWIEGLNVAAELIRLDPELRDA